MHDTPLPRAVQVGGLDRRELVQALREQGVQLNRAAEALLADERFTILSECKLVEIAAVSVGALGLANGATYQQLTARALELGLFECPLELGPHLRLQFVDQPEGAPGIPATGHGRAPPGSITVASRPLDEGDETPQGFYLRRAEGVLWLRGYWSWPGHVWSPEDVFVFSRPAPQPMRGTGVPSRRSHGRRPPVVRRGPTPGGERRLD